MTHSNILLLGILLLAGLLAGQFSNKIGIPRVAAYVLVGTLFSQELLGRYLPANNLEKWSEPLTHIALGVIAFIIGSSMTPAQLKRIGKSMIGIVFSESIGAVLIVFFSLILLAPKLDGISPINTALAFAAIAATTAPAGTIAVLHQYHAKGVFASTLLGVVALDDALGIILFSVVLAFLSGSSIGQNIELALFEISFSVLTGCIAGFLLAKLAIHIHKKSMQLPLVLSFILLETGVSESFHLSPLLSAMALGFSTRLFLYSAGDRLFGSIDFLEETVFLLFFTLAGTHFHTDVFFNHLDLIAIYFFARIAGKVLGAAFGGKMTKAPLKVTRWLGVALIPQAGVAIGLALTLSYQTGFEEISSIIINVVLATTLLYELIGPLATYIALKQAGEISTKKHNH